MIQNLAAELIDSLETLSTWSKSTSDDPDHYAKRAVEVRALCELPDIIERVGRLDDST